MDGEGLGSKAKLPFPSTTGVHINGDNQGFVSFSFHPFLINSNNFLLLFFIICLNHVPSR